MWFLGYPANIFFFFFFFFFFPTCNSSYSFIPNFLKLGKCFCHGLKMCMWLWGYPSIILDVFFFVVVVFFFFFFVFFFCFFCFFKNKRPLKLRCPGGRASGVERVNLFFFFQSYMLPLFFSGLLSYLVGMKRRTSRCFPCKRDNSHFLHYLKKKKNPFLMPLGVFLVYHRFTTFLTCFRSRLVSE